MTTPTAYETTAPSDISPTTCDIDPALTVRESVLGTATVREPDVSAATVREGQATAGGGSRSSDAGTGGSSFLRLPEGVAVRYRIDRELPTRGNEADLFVVRPLQDGDETSVVVKLYRANVHPKEEVLTRIAALDGQHVIRQIEHGVSEGRSYEVIEYAAEGSLADLMRETPFDEAMLKAMIREVTAGLGYLHSLDPPIVHRDVKPDNILVRRRDPLDLVLTDFGLSSVLEGGSWRASTLDRTIKYAAPEAGAGQVSREMDWWSLGMMVAEAASGRHPFAGVAEQTIGIHYSNRLPVPLDGIADERVKLLCQGLLCYDRKQRWGTEQVWRWIAGDTSLRPPVEETRQAAAGVPFKFAGGSYGTIRELAAAFAANWEAAQKTVARADGLLAWLKDEAKEYEAWQWLTEITQDKAQLDPGLKLTLLLPMLDPDMPVMFEGQELTQKRLLEEAAAAADGAYSIRTSRLEQLWDLFPALATLTCSAKWLDETMASVEKARKDVDDLVRTMGSVLPRKVKADDWVFVHHVMTYEPAPTDPNPKTESFKKLLDELRSEAPALVGAIEATDQRAAGTSWLLWQIEPHLRERLAKLQDRIAKDAAAKLGAKIRRLESDLLDAEWLPISQAGHADSVKSVTITRDGCRLLTASSDKTVRLWELASGRELRTFIGHNGPVHSVATTPDGGRFVTGSGDNTARLWDITTGKELRKFIGHTSPVYSICVTPDGLHLITGSHDKTVRIWELATGRELRAITGHTGWVWSVAVSPDGQQLATGSNDKTARLWDIATGRELRTFTGHLSSVHSVNFSPEGRFLATGSNDNTARLWSLTNGEQVHSFVGHSFAVWSIAITPDGQKAVTASSDNTVRLWDLKTGGELRIFTDNKAAIWSVAITPAGNDMVIGSADSTARLWHLETGQELRRFTRDACDPEGPSHWVRGIEVLTTGEILLDSAEAWRTKPVTSGSLDPMDAGLILLQRNEMLETDMDGGSNKVSTSIVISCESQQSTTLSQKRVELENSQSNEPKSSILSSFFRKFLDRAN